MTVKKTNKKTDNGRQKKTTNKRKAITKDKCLAEITIDGTFYSIRATIHARKRMKQRKVDDYIVTGNILGLGKEKILKLQEKDEEAIIIDEETDTATVIGFKKNTIKVITVVNTTNIYNSRGTKLVEL